MRRIGSRAVSWLVVAAMFALPIQGFALTVNTADIANGAVTTDKIADGAVTASKLGIVCANGEYLQYVFGSGWVCSVGTAGPQGPQGPQGPVGPMGTTPHYSNVIVVAKSGGDFTDIAAAIVSITDSSATNPYLIKVMPGVYTLDENTDLLIPPYVDIEGSGKRVTILNGLNISIRSLTKAEIRDITVTNGDNGSYKSFIIRSGAGAYPGANLSIYNTEINSIYPPELVGVSPPPCVDLIYDSTVALNNVICNVSGIAPIGIRMSDTSTLKSLNSSIITTSSNASNFAIMAQSYSPYNIFLVNTLMTATVYSGNSESTVKLLNCYDGNYNPIPNQ